MLLWKIKYWLKYKPAIAFYWLMAKLFGTLANATDELGYLLFGKEKWEVLKNE